MAIPSYPTIAAIGENLDRINALYSPFRARNLNPEHYEEKLRFWIKSVDDFNQVEKKSVFTVKELEIAFRSNGRVSACIPDVMEHMRGQRILVTEEEYLNSLKSDGWLSWSMKPMKFVASTFWNMTPLKTLTEKKITKETKLLYLPGISVGSSKLLACTDIQNKIMLKAEWLEQISKIIHPNEVELFTTYLTAKGYILSDKLGEDTEIIKFSAVLPSGPDVGITAAEKGQFDLTRTKLKLEQDLEHVLEQQNTCVELARKALHEKKRTQAKYHLRCKNGLEKRAEKLHNLITNLTDILYQIEDAKSDVMVISAYETGKKALEKVLKDNNITVDRATDAMLDLEEALEDQAEISSTLSRTVTVEDESLLEQELAELLELEELAKTPTKDREKDELREKPDMSEQLQRLQNLTLTDIDTLQQDTTPNKSLSQA